MKWTSLQKNARALRHNQTEPEFILWGYLRNRQFFGLKFRRQHQIGPYIADFVCLKEKVVIELDGGQHDEKDQIKYDKKRTAFMKSKGFEVIRYWNTDVLRNMEGVYEDLIQQVGIKEK